ncbi:acyl-CoA dehydrogenase family protein [Saccharothrix deserti]|uniref:acyl-CoA dehydrogenase family protein n=1 Tax=Saccharothrix deserti TaxID=2593674 RepID=UPI001EE3E322|nr:acyl-CoA dehydrogenase family protein [Saccharothrix deserti]
MLTIDPALLAETDEQAQLRSVLREFFADPGADWHTLAGQIGVPGLAVPERYGGAGYGFRELAVALGEAGRALSPLPLLSSAVLATSALLASNDDEACARHLPALAAGTSTATLGFGTVDAEAGRLRGAVDMVLDGADASLVLIPGRTPAGLTLFACADGFTRRPRRVLDPSRPQALLEFHDAPATPVGPPGGAEAILAAARDAGLAGLAAEQVGGCEHALEATVAHVRQRNQFGRPIGSFQAVKHRLADLLVEIEAAKSAAGYAAACVDAAPDELPVAASAAKVVCSAASVRAAAEYVQLHGGIGFTWEHPAHRYVRRARTSEVFLGLPHEHRARIAALLGLDDGGANVA